MTLDRVGLALWTPSDQIQVPERPGSCPVCGVDQFEPEDRLSALLQPMFSSGFSYVMGVWVHRACFDQCLETSEPDPIPW